jgi:hypothetical protein
VWFFSIVSPELPGIFMDSLSHRVLLISCMAICFLTGWTAITGGSLWIDEFGTWLITRAENLPTWWLRLKGWPDSDSQIPLYHLFMYFWTRLFGTDALVMRLSNLILFLLANFILILPFRSSPRLALALTVTTCLNAFLWYYLNELRPYIFLYLGVAMLYTSTIMLLKPGTEINRLGGAVALWCSGMLVSTGSSVLGFPWAGACFLFILVYWYFNRKRNLWLFVKFHGWIVAVSFIAGTLLLVHNFQMFFNGARATQMFNTNLQTMLFSAYSICGLLGIGPGMLAMREHGITALLPYIPLVAISCTVLIVVTAGGLLSLLHRVGVKTIWMLMAFTLLPVMFTFSLGYVLHWRVVGRHLMPVLPLIGMLYAFGLVWWYQKGRSGKAITIAAIFILSLSALSIRYAPRHEKDDYLRASVMAKEMLDRGGEVWWIADERGALYYNVPFSVIGEERPNLPQHNYAKVLSKTNPKSLEASVCPTMVLLSKPETFDAQSIVRNFLKAHGYEQSGTMQAFTVWEPRGGGG